MVFKNLVYNFFFKNMNICILFFLFSIFFLFLVNLGDYKIINLSFFKNFFYLNLDYLPMYLFIYNMFICYSCIFYSFKIKYNSNLYYFFIALFSILVLVSALFLVDNIFIFFLIYESILIPSAILCYISSPNLRSKNVTYYFIFWTQFGSFLFFFCIIYFFYKNVTFFNSHDLYKSNFILSIIFFFGFGVKIPVWPFHFWLTKTHVEVNTPFSIFLSGVLVKIALLGIYKFYFVIENLTFIFYFTVLVGVLDISLKLPNQVDFKKIVAYCTIFEMNMIIMGFLFYSYNTVIFYFIFCMLHTVLSNMFFLINDYIYKRYNTRNLSNINSVFISSPLLGTLLFLSVVVFNGIPFTLKFSIEFSLFLKIFNFDFFTFFLFYLTQIFFYIFFTKLNYTVLFQNINYTSINDLSRYEFLLFVFSFTILYVLSRWKNTVYTASTLLIYV